MARSQSEINGVIRVGTQRVETAREIEWQIKADSIGDLQDEQWNCGEKTTDKTAM